jgi:NitT/TauT family transport system substrate-binding protein
MNRTLIFCLLLAWLVPRAMGAEKTVLNVGHFPNVTHAQAMIAHGMSRAGKGWFELRLGPEVELRWFVYNAGPSAMEAIFTKAVDITYVGPNPAINAHLRSLGKEVRIVAGACSGGAALVVHGDGRIQGDADFKGRKVATPQLANTQDVAARAWLRSLGNRVTITGGDVTVVPAANPDQLALLRRGAIDAVWTIEPWVSRLVLEAGGKVYFEESKVWPETNGRYVTTHLVSSVALLEQRPALLKKFLAAHVELTEWIQANPDEAKRLFNAEMKAITQRALPADILDRAWSRLELTWDPVSASLRKSAEGAHALGFLRRAPELSRIYDLGPLNEVLRERGKEAVR